MECRGEFVFKTLEKREGGIFTNDKGENIKYSESYLLKVDELKDGKINERKLKFPVDNKDFAKKLEDLTPYTRVIIVFDVTMYSSNCKIVPVNVLINQNTK